MAKIIKTSANFRLSANSISNLEYIAQSISEGKTPNKTKALELSVKEKADSIKSKEKK